MILACSADIQIIDLSNNHGIINIDQGPALVQAGGFQLIHVINLQHFTVMVTQIELLAAKIKTENNFGATLESKIFELKKAYNSIKPKRFRRSWESLGSGIRFIAGNPDADDLRRLEKDIDILSENTNTLIKLNNAQALSNQKFNDKINEIISTISDLANNQIKENFKYIEILNLIINIDICKEKLEDIREAIVHTKNRIVTRNILEDNEIEFIVRRLKAQNVSLSSDSQSLPYLSSSIEFREDDILHYIVTIPQFKTGYKHVHVETVPKEGKIISDRIQI